MLNSRLKIIVAVTYDTAMSHDVNIYSRLLMAGLLIRPTLSSLAACTAVPSHDREAMPWADRSLVTISISTYI